MSLIEWSAGQFGTGVSQHDEEHKHLFGLLNQLHQQVSRNDRPAVGKALDELIAYVAKHFASEEQNMRAAGYAALPEHKREHDALVTTCVDLQKQFHAGAAEITGETTAFLRDWLFKHIPKIDRAYGTVLSAVAAR